MGSHDEAGSRNCKNWRYKNPAEGPQKEPSVGLLYFLALIQSQGQPTMAVCQDRSDAYIGCNTHRCHKLLQEHMKINFDCLFSDKFLLSSAPSHNTLHPRV